MESELIAMLERIAQNRAANQRTPPDWRNPPDFYDPRPAGLDKLSYEMREDGTMDRVGMKSQMKRSQGVSDKFSPEAPWWSK